MDLHTDLKRIDSDSTHQICSGTVIVCLATAVKELVENSLDAGATAIDIRLTEFGTELIEVCDNGHGVDERDFDALALKSHTSKIAKFDDLTTVDSFGFRGEAISALASLSDLTVHTKTPDAQIGYELKFDRKGGLLKKTMLQRQPGTTVYVRELFCNLPVRKEQFHHNVKREFAKLLRMLYGYGIIASGVKISCSNISKGKNIFVMRTAGHAEMVKNIKDIFGNESTSKLVPMSSCSPTPDILDEFNLRTDVHLPCSFEGWISGCQQGSGRSANDRQFLFINKRPCEYPKITKLTNQVYREYNVRDHPFYAINIVLERESIDINVVPNKNQVLVQNEKFLLASLKASLRQTFGGSASSIPFNIFKASTTAAVVAHYPPSPVVADPKAMQHNIFNRLRYGINPTTSPGKNENANRSPMRPKYLNSATRYPHSSPSAKRRDNSPKITSFFQPPLVINLDPPFDEASFGSRIREPPSPHKTASPAKRRQQLHSSFGPDIEEASYICGDTNKNGTRLHIFSQFSTQKSTPQAPPNNAFGPFLPVGFSGFEDPDNLPQVSGSVSATEHRTEFPFPQDNDILEHGNSSQLPARSINQIPVDFVGFDDGLDSASQLDPLALGQGMHLSFDLEGERTRPRTVPRAEIDVDFANDFDLDIDMDRSEKTSIKLPAKVLLSVGKGDDLLRTKGPKLPQNFTYVQNDVPEKNPDVSRNAESLVQDYVDNRCGNNLLDSGRKQSVGSLSSSEIRLSQQNRFSASMSALRDHGPLKAGSHKQTSSHLNTSGNLSTDDVVEKTKTIGLIHGKPPMVLLPVTVEDVKSSHDKAIEDRDHQSVISKAHFHARISPSQNDSAETELQRNIQKTDFIRMKIIGQFNDGFIITRLDEDIFIIDQHASDERFNYESLQKSFTVQSQKMIRALPLELTAVEETILLENRHVFQKSGFDFIVDANAEKNRVSLSAVPLSHNITYGKEDVMEMIHVLGETEGMNVRPSRVLQLLASKACRKSVMIGKPLSQPEMATIVNHMGALIEPWRCAHGRPTMRHLGDLKQLEKSHLSAMLIEEEENGLRIIDVGSDHVLLPNFGLRQPGKVHYVDLSFNRLRSLSGLEIFPNLQTLILDNNDVTDDIILPRFSELRVFSLNKNYVCNLDSFLAQLEMAYPQLAYFSFLYNPACPNELSHSIHTDKEYELYRRKVLVALPGLRFLDSREVTDTERFEAGIKVGRCERRKSVTFVEKVEPFPLLKLPTLVRPPQTRFGKLKHHYGGNNSEGNRFISDRHL